MGRHVRFTLLAFAALISVLAFTGVRANGDCREYVLMARAFASHGTPDIRKADVAWLVQTEPFLGRVVPVERLADDSVPELIPHLMKAQSGRYYSLHFWLYSLLAAPFIRVTDAVGARPLLALSAVNACAALALTAYLIRFFAGSVVRFMAPVLFLSCGAVFYLHWPGPEILTASAVLVATLSGLQGRIGLGMLAAGVAAAQNPSAAGILLLVCGHWLALRCGWLPELEGSRAARLDARELALVCASLTLLLLPYAFFQAAFGLPSLTARLATRSDLISFDRAWSLLFDLNQGLFVGMPGLFLALVLLSAIGLRRSWTRRERALSRTVLVCMAFLVMLVPTLSIENWNSGGVVVHRYCTWLAMPLLGAVLTLLPKLPVVRQRGVAGAFLVAQALVLASNGLSADPTLYLRHGRVARYVLQHWPSAYNPVREIFIERTLTAEVRPRQNQTVVWPRQSGEPRKVLVHQTRPLTVARGCLPGQTLVGLTEPRLDHGWRYVNAPFRCADP
jgi:hypothetical protein